MRSLYGIYKENKYDMDILDKLSNKIMTALECPCARKKKCIHKLINFKEKGFTNCSDYCELSAIWVKMKNEIIGIINAYLWGVNNECTY